MASSVDIPAFELVRVVDRTVGGKSAKDGTIVCADCFEGKFIYVGTSDGSLLLYVIERQRRGQEGFQTRLETKRSLGVGKKEIECVLALDGSPHVLVMCDGAVTAHDLRSLASSTPAFPSPKGACLMILDTKHRGRVGVFTKKKLSLFQYARDDNTGKDYELLREFSLTDQPLTAAWSGDVVIMGTKTEYILLHVPAGELNHLFPIAAKAKPLVTVVRREKEIVAALDNAGMYITFEGAMAARSSILWNQTPQFLSFLFPFVVAVLPSGLRIQSVYDETLAQALPFSGTVHLAARPEALVLSTPTEVYTLIPSDMGLLVGELIKRRRYADALKYAADFIPKADPERASSLRRVREDIGFALLGEGLYKRGLGEIARAETDPREVIYVYGSPLTPKDVAYEGRHLAAMAHLDLCADTEALTELLRHLESVRGLWIEHSVREAIDTALFKLYVLLDLEGLREFLESGGENACAESDCSSFISEREAKLKCWHLHALFLLSKDNVAAALDIWVKFGNHDYEDGIHDGVVDTIRVLEQTTDWALIVRYAPWVMERAPMLALSIVASPGREVFPPNLVLDFLTAAAPFLYYPYLEYVVMKLRVPEAAFHTKLAVHLIERVKQEIEEFTEPPSRPALLALLDFSDLLDVPALFALIHGTKLYHANALLCCKLGQHQRALAVLVHEARDTDAAEEYCVTVERKRSQRALGGGLPSNPNSNLSSSSLLSPVPSASSSSSASTSAATAASTSTSTSTTTTTTMSSSSSSSSSNGLPSGSGSASTSSGGGVSMGSASSALMTGLGLTARSFDGSLHAAAGLETSSIFTDLLRLLLESDIDYSAAARGLLERNFKHFDLLQVLELIPPSWPLSELEGFLTNALRLNSSTQRMGQAVKGVLRTQHTNTRHKLVRLQSKFIRVDSRTPCPVCKRPLGDRAIAFFPNHVAVHYKCFLSKTVCPVTGRDFSARPLGGGVTTSLFSDDDEI